MPEASPTCAPESPEPLSQWMGEVQRALAGWLMDWHAREASWALDAEDLGLTSLAFQGKKVRPRLMLAVHAACGGRFGPGLCAVAAALELFHGASLIYDDIQDNAQVRRGEPAFHVTHGVSTALSACSLLSWHVHRILLEKGDLDDASRLWIARRFTTTLVTTALGQMADTRWVRDERLDLTEEESWRMLRSKTAFVFAYAAEAGAYLGTGGDESVASAFREFGERLGMLFQMVDDHADLFLPDTDGKPRGQDLREAKRTLYLLHARRHLPDAERAEFDRRCRLPERTDEDVAWLLERLRETGAEDMGLAHIRRLDAEAQEILAGIAARRPLDPAYAEILSAMLKATSRGLA